MKYLISALLLAFSFNSFANSLSVRCAFRYDDASENGEKTPRLSGLDIEKGLNKYQIGAYQVETALDQVCAADGGPCFDAATFAISITAKNGTVSTVFEQLGKQDIGRRFGVNMATADDTRGIQANCDVSSK